MSDLAAKLDEARALIEKGWCQETYAKGKRLWIAPSSRSAVCFCALGAIARVTKSPPSMADHTRAAAVLADAIAGNHDSAFETITDFNDAPERTQAEVIEAFRKAAELARAEAQ